MDDSKNVGVQFIESRKAGLNDPPASPEAKPMAGR